MFALAIFAITLLLALTVVGTLRLAWTADRVVTFLFRFHRARPLRRSDLPALFDAVEQFSLVVRVTPPALSVIDGDIPNAFALRSGRRETHLLFTKAALELEHSALCALVAHELYHIAQGHVRRGTLDAAVGAALREWGAETRQVELLHRLGMERDLSADRMARSCSAGSLHAFPEG
jgi:Zn-dependent protease with chaperone function